MGKRERGLGLIVGCLSKSSQPKSQLLKAGNDRGGARRVAEPIAQVRIRKQIPAGAWQGLRHRRTCACFPHSDRLNGGGAQDTRGGDEAPGQVIAMGRFKDFPRQHGSKELPQGIRHDDEAQKLSQRGQTKALGSD